MIRRHLRQTVLGLLIGALFVFACFHASIAYAQGLPDPVADPAGTLSVFAKLYHSGAYLLIGIVVLFYALRYASNHVAWLEAPNRAHYVSAVVGGFALIALPASQGTTPNLQMILVALGTTIAMFGPGLTAKQGS